MNTLIISCSINANVCEMNTTGTGTSGGSRRALVTGACGFVGSHLVEHLTATGWDVVATDLESTHRGEYYATREASDNESMPEPSHFETDIDKLKVEFVPTDITDPEQVTQLFVTRDPYDVVFHTASLYDYFADRETLDRVNITGGRNVATAANRFDVDQFVHWSTLGVVGGSASESEPIQEDASYNPHNRYGESKVEQEQILFDLKADEGLPLTVLRPAPIYGPRHRYGIYHLLYLYRKVGTGFIWPIYPRDQQLRFPSVHVSDLVRAAIFVTQHPAQTVGEVYHVTSDPIAQDDLIEFITKALGLPQYRIPMPWPLYRFIANRLVETAELLEQRARQNDNRPKFPMSMAQYLTRDFWYVNDKLCDLGFEFEYADPREGLWEYITWCKERGLV